MVGFAREVARRVFASELRDSDYTFREDDSEYAPLYLITPTGARCNRVMLVGTLTEKDNLGDDVEYWRGRVADPTGSIFVYAGQYQPDAAQALSGTEPPAFVAVVGKPSVYETEDGKRLISVRAESVQQVDAETRDRWVLETAARTLDRIEAFKAFLDTQGSDAFSSGEELLKRAELPGDAADIGKAHLHYQTDLARYGQMVARALTSLKGEISEPKSEVSGSRSVREKPSKKSLAASGPAWEEDAFEAEPEEYGEAFRRRGEGQKGHPAFDEDYEQEIEDIEEPGMDFKDAGRSSRKRKER
ncbi:MAG TPA: hypothetical protein PLZ42_01985 [Methanothrix sp.]|nr:hypothetical protein [Methanothrix sp.]